MDYILYTLVDITNTGRFRADPGYDKERNQQQNFNTVLQTIGMRSNIDYRKRPELIKGVASEYGFDFDDTVSIWAFEWSTEREEIWLEDGDHLALLRKDFEFVPYIANLDESMIAKRAVFRSQGTDCNIVFKLRA